MVFYNDFFSSSFHLGQNSLIYARKTDLKAECEHKYINTDHSTQNGRMEHLCNWPCFSYSCCVSLPPVWISNDVDGMKRPWKNVLFHWKEFPFCHAHHPFCFVTYVYQRVFHLFNFSFIGRYLDTHSFPSPVRRWFSFLCVCWNI